MGQMLVRALQKCFVGGCLRKVGQEFMVPDTQVLRTKKKPPVMERVDAEPEPPATKKRGGFKKKAADPEAED